jgi:ribosome maturation factor RimP
VSEQVSAVLDVEDEINGKYNLEVSSPGLYRPLFTAAHFQLFSGEQIKLTMGMAFEGRRKFAGEIIECTDKILSLQGTDGESWELPLNDVANAHLNPQISFSKR